MGETEWCQERVYDSGMVTSRGCSRKALPGKRYCAHHSPEAKAKRDKRSSERYAAERQREAEASERRAVELLRGLGYTVIAPGTSGGDTDA